MLIAHALVLALAASSWLDAPAPANWNVAGASIPRAPHADTSMNARCIGAGLTRKPASALDRAVVAAGWMLFNKPNASGTSVILDGQAGFDGMCRPLYYQAFVFAGGRFAGTLAPKPMQSRTLGSLQFPKFASAAKIVATFNHYADSDPLCCPSKLTDVAFLLKTTSRGPLVAPLSARTYASQ
jgi:hypothetical protein